MYKNITWTKSNDIQWSNSLTDLQWPWNHHFLLHLPPLPPPQKKTSVPSNLFNWRLVGALFPKQLLTKMRAKNQQPPISLQRIAPCICAGCQIQGSLLALRFVAGESEILRRGYVSFEEGTSMYGPQMMQSQNWKSTRTYVFLFVFVLSFFMYPVTWRIMVLVENDPDLKGKSAWRYIHFPLNHDCVRKSKKLFHKWRFTIATPFQQKSPWTKIIIIFQFFKTKIHSRIPYCPFALTI